MAIHHSPNKEIMHNNTEETSILNAMKESIEINPVCLLYSIETWAILQLHNFQLIKLLT